MSSEGRPRVREAGVVVGELPTGSYNAITDVDGVKVGQVTLIAGDGPLVPGEGPVRTGVTVVMPHSGNVFRSKVPAAVHVINGFGKCMGQEQIEEMGTIESPIALTGTMNVGLVTDALVAYGIRENPDIGVSTSTINPIVGECSDSYLNDMHGRHVREEHVLAAIDGAFNGPVAEGSVGAGTGMSAFGFKGGVGTASRVIPQDLGGWTIGMLVVANIGRRRQLTIDGVPVGRLLDDERHRDEVERGSIMFVLATDAPLLSDGLRRLARRVTHGLARTGSISGNGSGDYVIAFSTDEALRVPHEPESLTLDARVVAPRSDVLDALFQAVVESTEEAILNALFVAEPMTGRDGNHREALPVDRVLQYLGDAGRLQKSNP